jgi:hypothetical protein
MDNNSVASDMDFSRDVAVQQISGGNLFTQVFGGKSAVNGTRQAIDAGKQFFSFATNNNNVGV